MLKFPLIKNNYTPDHIANYFLLKAWNEGSEITPMKLIKLVYIAYGWNLAINEERLFEEKIEAWRYGPVIPSIYREYKRFGSNQIPKNHFSAEIDLGTGEVLSVPVVNNDDINTKQLLDAVWQCYQNKTGVNLSNITHEIGSAWDIAWREKPNTTLDNDIIKRRSQKAVEKYMKQMSKEY